jgi:SSS family transporter
MNELLGLPLWDWFALALYVVGIVAIGVWTMRKVSDTADFFMGGRKTNKLLMVFFAFGVGTSGNDAVGVSSKTYTSGMSGIWYQWLWLFATPFYWIIAPFFRRMRAITTGDYFEHRYDGSVAGLYAIVGVGMLTVNIGGLLLGSGRMIDAITDGAIAYNWAIIIVAVSTVIIGVAGGLHAAILTDFVQGILTVLLSFILLPFVLKAAGGMTGLRGTIQDEHMFSLVSPGEINLFHICMIATLALIGIVTQPHIMGVCAAGRNEMDGRIGFVGGNLLKRLCTIPWMLTGLCAVALYPGLTGSEPDLVYGRVARDMLPAIMPGLLGVFLASLLASVMSSCDAQMVSSSGLFTQNFYRRYLARDKSETHYVNVGRMVSVLIVVFSLSFAYTVKDVPEALEWFFRVQALMGAAFWLGLYWRGATPLAAWAGTLAGFLVMMLTSREWFHAWATANLPDMMIWEGKFRLSFNIFFYLSTSFATAIGVSLLGRLLPRDTGHGLYHVPVLGTLCWLGRRVPDEKLDRVYNCLRTPIGKDEPHLPPFTLPPGVEPGPPNKLINHPDLEIPKPTAVGFGGFVVIWLIVAALIAFVYWIAGLGAPPA